MDITKLSAVEVAKCIKRKEISALEVLDATFSHIDEVNSTCNAFVNLDITGARAQASRADQMVADCAADQLPDFHGVPFTVKDLLNTAGLKSTYGSRAFADFIPDTDAVGVARMRRAGAILIAKTTTPEFAMKVTTDSLLSGITRNPWDTQLTPGGSSGGAGAAVATGMGALAVSTDGGGSARIPAAACGILGLKPTLGAIPHETWPFHFGNNSTVSVNTRTVPDLVAMFNAMAGAHACDPWSRRSRRIIQLSQNPIGKLKGKKLLLMPVMAGNSFDKQWLEPVEAMLDLLACSGLHIEVADSDRIAFDPRIFSKLLTVNLAARIRMMSTEEQQLLDPVLQQLLDPDYGCDGIQLQQDAIERSRLYDRVEAVLTQFDFIVTPTLAAKPPRADSVEVQRVNINGKMQPLSRWWIHLALANMTGHPALSIPSGFTSDRLPAGCNVIGRWDSEQDLFDLAALIADVQPWMDSWPALLD